MKIKEFNGILKDSAQFNIRNHSGNIPVNDFIMQKETITRKSYLGKIAYSMVSLVLVFLLSFYIFLRMTPVTTLTIDINPSFVVELNAFDRVVSITGSNTEADTFLKEINVKNKKVGNLVDVIYKKGIEKGYFAENEAFMLVGVFSSDYESELKIGDLLADFTEVTFLTVFQHLELEQVYLSPSEARISDATYSSGSSAENAVLGEVDSVDILPEMIEDSYRIDFTSNIQLASYADELGVSQARLIIAIEVFNSNSEYNTIEQLDDLANLPIEELMNEYNSIK